MKRQWGRNAPVPVPILPVDLQRFWGGFDSSKPSLDLYRINFDIENVLYDTIELGEQSLLPSCHPCDSNIPDDSSTL